MDKIKKILVAQDGKRFYVRDLNKDFHTQHGYIKKSDLKKKSGTTVRTNTGKQMRLLRAAFIDSYQKIKRAPQIISLKDIGQIIAETGINKKSLVVDAGSGSGALCCFLANIAKKVVTYEIRADFVKLVKKNIDFLGLNNVEVKQRDIYEGISERNVDLVTLDLPEPWKALEHAHQALRVGGFVVSYSPTVPQAADLVNRVLETEGLMHVKTTELIEREWEMTGRKVRPRSRMIAHTGFLSFARRIK